MVLVSKNVYRKLKKSSRNKKLYQLRILLKRSLKFLELLSHEAKNYKEDFYLSSVLEQHKKEYIFGYLLEQVSGEFPKLNYKNSNSY